MVTQLVILAELGFNSGRVVPSQMCMLGGGETERQGGGGVLRKMLRVHKEYRL